jgi:23S rRNA (adenine2503-C2)-methyltransferase
MKKYTIPTGYLFTDSYSKGLLETLSIGDYGKAKNVKADFLGYTKDLNGVPDTYCMPLSEKWVVTVSTQYGCLMKCKFCDVPNVKYHGNASFEDLYCQLKSAIALFPTVKYTERLNLHFARMGEPSFNPNVIKFAEFLYKNKRQVQEETGLRIETIHPVLTTMMPKNNKDLIKNLRLWAELKNDLYNGQAGLQISINSTDDKQRDEMFSGDCLDLQSISDILSFLPSPISRKYCINIAYSSDYIVDAEKLASLFDPSRFMVKITPIHNNNACATNNYRTIGGYESYRPYKEVEESLKEVGFDVLVFVPSLDEEDGLVTCGNVVLGDSKLKYDSDMVKIEGLPA